MKFAVYCANFGFLGDPKILIDLAIRADAAGWDGFFVYDHIMIVEGRAHRSADPWVVLSVVAAQTGLWFGPMVTPAARRLPWELAHQALTLDTLSGGRLTMGFGLGERPDYAAFGDQASDREHGERLDEAIGIVRALWAGERVTHRGHWVLRDAALAPRPVNGTIPIWIAGRYGASRPLERAAGYDGMFPINRRWDLTDLLQPDHVREIAAQFERIRGTVSDFDLVTAGVSPDDTDAAGAVVAPYIDAGATWWLEILEPRRASLVELRGRVTAGPPGCTPRP